MSLEYYSVIATLEYYSHLLSEKKPKDKDVGKHVEEGESSHSGGNGKGVVANGKFMDASQAILK